MRRETFGLVALVLATAGAAGVPALPSTTPPAAAETAQTAEGWRAPGNRNPILPGYFADPSIVRDAGRWYVFATMDPWGGDRLALWTSTNGRDWRFSTPDWPTKAAATSPTSGDAKVWAPSVVKARNGRWYMYVSVGSEIWVGTAPSAAGPWRDANGGKPLVAKGFAPAFHMIDAEAFIDDDGTAYLYWGSGLNWVNGHCFVVRLKPDMVTFDGIPRDVTPPHYFEAPFMVKAGGRYLLSYSNGNTTKDTYEVRYAVGDTPFGPFREGAGSPVLSTDLSRDVVSPGHHAVFPAGGGTYVLYGRQALPWPRGGDEVLRQVAADRLEVRKDGSIARLVPSHDALVSGWASRRERGLPWQAMGTEGRQGSGPAMAADDNYATLWRPGDGEKQQLVADLGSVKRVSGSSLRPEYPQRSYSYAIDSSSDGVRWQTIVQTSTRSGSPIDDRLSVRARFLRLRFPNGGVALWEWTIR